MKKTILGLLAFALLFSFACGGGGNPEDTVKAMMEAMKSGNYSAAKALVVTDSSSFPGEDEFKAGAELFKALKYEIGETTIDGDTATVLVKMTMEFMGEEQSTEEPMTLKKVGGKWLIAD